MAPEQIIETKSYSPM